MKNEPSIMKNLLIIFLVIIGLVSLGIGARLLLFPKTVFVNTINTAVETNNEIMDGKNAIYNYEWFKQQEADILRLYEQEKIMKRAMDNFIETMPTNKGEWDWMDKQSYQRHLSNHTAQELMVNRAINDYNARSSMVSRNIFKDNLPSNLSRSWLAQRSLITN